MPVTYLDPTQTDPTQQGTITYTSPSVGPSPDPHDPLATQPETWGQWGTHLGRAAESGALYGLTSPLDVPASVVNTAADIANRYLGTNLPISPTYGQRIQEALRMEQPVTPMEHIVAGGAGLGVGGLYGNVGGFVGGQTPGEMFATTLRQLPTNVALGAGQGAMQAGGLPPEAQLGLTLGGTRLAGGVLPGLMTSERVTSNERALAEFLQNRDVPVNPAALSPRAAQAVYERFAPYTGGRGFAEDQYKKWADSVGSEFGAATDAKGVFTGAEMNRAEGAINGLYRGVTSAPNMAAGPGTSFYNRLDDIQRRAAGIGTPGGGAPAPAVVDYINNIRNHVNTDDPIGGPGRTAKPAGDISAATMQGMLRTDSDLSKLISAREPFASTYYQQIRNVIEDEFGTHLIRTDPTAFENYQRANNQWRSFKTVEAARDPTTGRITPQSLAGSVSSSGYEPTGGTMDTLAKAGVRFVPVPPSEVSPDTAALARGRGIWEAAKDIGLTGLGIGELAQIAGARGAAAGAAAAPFVLGATRMGRAFPTLGAPPTTGQYYARALTTPGLYVAPGVMQLPGATQ